MSNLTAIKVKDLPAGEFFKRKPDAKKVYVREDYIPSEKKYVCVDWDDICREMFIKGDTIVYTGFEY